MEWKDNSVVLLHVNMVVGLALSIIIIAISAISLIPGMMYLGQQYFIQYLFLVVFFHMVIGNLVNSVARIWSLYRITKFKNNGRIYLILFLVITTVSAFILPIAVLAIESNKTELECFFFLQFVIGPRSFNMIACAVILIEILAGLFDMVIVLSIDTRVFMMGNSNLRFAALQIVQLTNGTTILSFVFAIAQILCIILTETMENVFKKYSEDFKEFGKFLFSIVLFLPLFQVSVLLIKLRKRHPKVTDKIDPVDVTKRMWKNGPKKKGNNGLFFTNCSATPIILL